MTSTSALRRSLADAIAQGSTLADPAWRRAIEEVPREVFLGEAVYRKGSGERGTRWEPVRREQLGETEWLRLANTNDTWVTQVDGVSAADAPEPLYGSPTSSSTLPSLVVRMLELAGVQDGDKVLEVGTGTGYSTALLCHRLGEKQVFSVEYDPEVAAAAAGHIHAAGYAPTLVTGDGLDGYEPGEEYDRVVVTCSVRHIPRPWIWQVRVGGTIAVTLSGWLQASGAICLTVAEDGSATGRFTGETISYMLARPHCPPPRSSFFRYDGSARPARVDPMLLKSWTGHFVAQLGAPTAELMMTTDGVILIDVATGSQAWTERAGDGWTVHQHGALRLWDQAEDALLTWQSAGSPDQSAFGMTITEDAQRVWLGGPEGASWLLPV